MKKKYYWIIGIVIVIVIVIGISFLFPDPYAGTLGEPTPKAIACTELLNSNCEKSTNSILVKHFDANKDDKRDSADILFELCKNYYGCEDEACCKKVCRCAE